MTNESLADRLLDAHARLAAWRPVAEAGGPWPPSPDFGHAPESSWNPPELLAHVAEMLPYWLGQIERILEGYPEPVSFGRVGTDENRIAAIGRDRALPVGELFDRVAERAGQAAERLRAMSAADLERRGTHPTLGEMTVKAVVERMYINHLNEHADQLQGLVRG
ncbi:MAG TPA: DinB family protein [Clostridia bacterium]|nr:DinB family protein [Clostridia bacterium]